MDRTLVYWREITVTITNLILSNATITIYSYYLVKKNVI